MKNLTPILLTTTLFAPTALAQGHAEAAASKRNLVEVAQAAGNFQTLLTAAKAAGLVATLSGDTDLTVFAPTDAAFAKLPEGALDSLLADTDKLKAILLYHVVPGKVKAEDVVGLQWAGTVQGQAIRVQAGDDGVMVDGAKVIATDIAASNGVIHVIDSVILPRKDIVDTAIAAGDFGSLVKAVQAAGMVEALRGKGPFTVFAPRDAAFAKVPAEALQSLLADKARLQAVLGFHVVEGRVLSTDLPIAKKGESSAMPETLQGGKLTVVRTKDGVTINGANVVAADVIAGNGVIHIIDTVIMPPAKGEGSGSR